MVKTWRTPWARKKLGRKIDRGSSSTNFQNLGRPPKNCVQIKVDGVIYESIAQAIRESGRSRTYIRRFGERQDWDEHE